MTERELEWRARHRLAVLRHAGEISGSVAATSPARAPADCSVPQQLAAETAAPAGAGPGHLLVGDGRLRGGAGRRLRPRGGLAALAHFVDGRALLPARKRRVNPDAQRWPEG
jgi:hypothetical protein